MNRISRHQKSISVFLIFVILIQLPGCVSTKVVKSVSDIPPSKKYTYIINSTTTSYQLMNASISNGTVSGNLINGRQTQTSHKVHFYLVADSVMKNDTINHVVIPLDKLSKIEVVSPAIGATSALFGGIIIVVLAIIALVTVNEGYRGM